MGLVVPNSSCHNRLQKDPKVLGTLSPRPWVVFQTLWRQSIKDSCLFVPQKGTQRYLALQLSSLGDSLGHYLGGGLWASLTFLSLPSTPAASLWFFSSALPRV